MKLLEVEYLLKNIFFFLRMVIDICWSKLGLQIATLKTQVALISDLWKILRVIDISRMLQKDFESNP